MSSLLSVQHKKHRNHANARYSSELMRLTSRERRGQTGVGSLLAQDDLMNSVLVDGLERVRRSTFQAHHASIKQPVRLVSLSRAHLLPVVTKPKPMFLVHELLHCHHHCRSFHLDAERPVVRDVRNLPYDVADKPLKVSKVLQSLTAHWQVLVGFLKQAPQLTPGEDVPPFRGFGETVQRDSSANKGNNQYTSFNTA